ncbi:hypothetical protein KRR38_01585 [Novosphingobium sp. G106]|uniref:hypothetical protein n=1 Tax=Novosphingobium sp. G106 TaxID=2849500 RepID=UPI001C2D1B54|nr:hypothetical protein [Novosphingobium sp. G106]MBV1686395.1 hypothetical protein [Novosphingobium sp. G106]
MAARPSRAYKLKLSREGIALFIECHCRLCHLVGDLLPYGTTLRVSVTMLEATPLDELASELVSGELTAFGGKEIRFVGTSPTLATLTAQLSDRAAANSAIGSAPQTWRLFLAALSLMRIAEDAFVVRTYETLRECDETLRMRRGELNGTGLVRFNTLVCETNSI